MPNSDDDIDVLLMDLLRQPPEQRRAHLDRVCRSDTGLRRELEHLLRLHDQAGDFLEQPAVARRLQDVDCETPGCLIGPYQLVEQIGEGGFGCVWMAEQNRPIARRVALKIIKLGMDTRQVIARFEAERQALALMDHPNIARVFDAGATDSGRPYFVMELVQGTSITKYCAAETLSTTQRLRLFIDVCHAVQHAHHKGIIHRDIKPSNVLVTSRDRESIPKVIDFGIAKATDLELTQKTFFTEFRQLIGTPEYMSPEQAGMSGQDIDTRSDIYSLGVLLYELLTGVTPFDSRRLRSKSFDEIQRIIREQDPCKPSTRLSALRPADRVQGTQPAVAEGSRARGPDPGGTSIVDIARERGTEPQALLRRLRGDLDCIVMKCLEKDRSRRYETVNGLAADIERHLNNEPVTASPPSRSYRLRKFVRRHRGGVMAAVAVTAALLLGVIGTTSGMVWAMANQKKATRAGERAQRELARANEVKQIIKDMLSGVSRQQAAGADLTLLKGILDQTSTSLGTGEIDDPLIAAELHDLIGETYRSLGLYEEAEQHLPQALDIRERELRRQHPGELSSMTNLTLLYDMVRSRNKLASLYLDQGQFSEAESLHVETIAIWEDFYGPEHPNTLNAKNNLATTYARQDRDDEAERLYFETLAVRLRELGPAHADSRQTMCDLKQLYERQGRDAAGLYAEVLEIEKRVLGEADPATANAMGELAICYARQGRFAEAQRLLGHTLELQRRLYGEKHRSTLGTMTNLGRVHLDQGHLQEALRLLERSVPIKRRVLGIDDPWTRLAMEGLAQTYERLDRREDALLLWGKLLELRLRSAARPDADASTLNDAAWSLLTHPHEELHDPAEALSLAERACAVEEAAGGENLWMYLDTLALAHHRTGNTAAALDIQRRALSLLPVDRSDLRAEFETRLFEYEEFFED